MARGSAVKQVLGPGDAVEVAGDRLEAVVDRDGAVVEVLDLLQDRIGAAIGEDIAGDSRTGKRFTCASAAAVTMFVAPGPMEEVTAIAFRRRLVLA